MYDFESFFFGQNLDTDGGNKNTTPQGPVQVTSRTTWHKEETPTTISVATPSGRYILAK